MWMFSVRWTHSVQRVCGSKIIESIQRRWTRAISSFEGVPYCDRLKHLDLFSLKGRLLRSDLIFVWKTFHGHSTVSPHDIFVLAGSNATRGHCYKIYLPRTRLDARSRYFSVRVISAWNSLSDEAVLSESLPQFKRLLKRDLGSLLYEYVT